MKKPFLIMCFCGAFSLFLPAAVSFGAATIWLDADTPATGSLLVTVPLVTPYGTITFDGEIRDPGGDTEFIAAGAFGNVFDIYNTPNQTARLSFDFDVQSVTFIYGGNMGSILVEARDAFDAVLVSFYQESTYVGEPAGPVTLSMPGIRSLYWQETVSDRNFAPLDNIELSVVPAPGAILLGSIGAGLVSWLRRRRTL